MKLNAKNNMRISKYKNIEISIKDCQEFYGINDESAYKKMREIFYSIMGFDINFMDEQGRGHTMLFSDTTINALKIKTSLVNDVYLDIDFFLNTNRF